MLNKTSLLRRLNSEGSLLKYRTRAVGRLTFLSGSKVMSVLWVRRLQDRHHSYFLFYSGTSHICAQNRQLILKVSSVLLYLENVYEGSVLYEPEFSAKSHYTRLESDRGSCFIVPTTLLCTEKSDIIFGVFNICTCIVHVHRR